LAQQPCPAFEAKARDLTFLYVNALRFYEQAVWSSVPMKRPVCRFSNANTPRSRCKRASLKSEHEYIRRGVRALIASFVIPTGHVVCNLSTTCTSADCAAHLANVVAQLPAMTRYDWVVANLNTHWSLDVYRLVAQWCAIPFVPKTLRRGMERRAVLSDPTHTHVFHLTPKHGSWLNQVEL
jgi:hypothetical protein